MLPSGKTKLYSGTSHVRLRIPLPSRTARVWGKTILICRRHKGRHESIRVWHEYALRTRGECVRLGLSQEADCLPVSLFMLHSSSQAQVCVGSGMVLSDDSNSRCVLAPSHASAHTHRQRETHNYTLAQFLTCHTRTHTTLSQMESRFMYSLHTKIIITT